MKSKHKYIGLDVHKDQVRPLVGGIAGVSARLPRRTGSNPMESEWVFSPVATEAVNGN